jgi:hypothetical protein
MLLGYPAEALVLEYAIWLLDEAGIVHGSLYSRWSEIGRWRSRLRDLCDMYVCKIVCGQ